MFYMRLSYIKIYNKWIKHYMCTVVVLETTFGEGGVLMHGNLNTIVAVRVVYYCSKQCGIIYNI